MAGNTFGKLFRVTTAGVSHGPGYLVIVDGRPPGLPLAEADLLPDLARRRPGQSKIVTQRKEEDTPEIGSGASEGVAAGRHSRGATTPNGRLGAVPIMSRQVTVLCRKL